MKVCVLLGPPGAGKGTQASLLSGRLGGAHISTGLIIRNEIASGSTLGKTVKSVVESGQLVSDDLLFECLNSGLSQLSKELPFLLLDGVPRTVSQVSKLDEVLSKLGLKVDVAVAVSAPLERLVERFSKRWTCSSCGNVTSLETEAQAATETCSKCGKVGLFNRRPDDEPEAVRTRFEVYEKETAPLMDIFQKRGLLKQVDGLRPVERVYVDVANQLFAN